MRTAQSSDLKNDCSFSESAIGGTNKAEPPLNKVFQRNLSVDAVKNTEHVLPDIHHLESSST